MSFNSNNEVVTKTSFIRLKSLKKRFANYYNHEARDIFMNLDRQTQLKILRSEFTLDKELIVTLDSTSPRLISRIIKERGLE